MTDAKHTPLPWRTEEDETSTIAGFPDITAESYTIVGQEGMYGVLETDWANAAFIVRACNAHYDLVEALRGLLRATNYADRNEERIDAAEIARAALAKAEGKE